MYQNSWSQNPGGFSAPLNLHACRLQKSLFDRIKHDDDDDDDDDAG